MELKPKKAVAIKNTSKAEKKVVVTANTQKIKTIVVVKNGNIQTVHQLRLTIVYFFLNKIESNKNSFDFSAKNQNFII